jgi:hypothetical protein
MFHLHNLVARLVGIRVWPSRSSSYLCWIRLLRRARKPHTNKCWRREKRQCRPGDLIERLIGRFGKTPIGQINVSTSGFFYTLIDKRYLAVCACLLVNAIQGRSYLSAHPRSGQYIFYQRKRSRGAPRRARMSANGVFGGRSDHHGIKVQCWRHEACTSLSSNTYTHFSYAHT